LCWTTAGGYGGHQLAILAWFERSPFRVSSLSSFVPLTSFEAYFRMHRASLILAAIVAVLLCFTLAVSAAHVCKEKDCADIVGEGMVRDNLGHSDHFNQRHHDDWREEARLHRVEIKRRERHVKP
jgi:hypothetical protein